MNLIVAGLFVENPLMDAAVFDPGKYHSFSRP